MASSLFKRLRTTAFNLIRKPLILVFAAFACTACATTGGAPSQLTAGMPVAAPMGLFEFCVRNPGECDIGDAMPTDLSAKAVQTAGDGAPADVTATGTVLSVPAIEPVREPVAALSLARAINTFVNQAITYRPDLEVWGVEDYWTLPLSKAGVPYGDCEDYALEKRAMLLAAGVPPGKVRLALVWSRLTGHHAVLVLSVDGVEYVLDNAIGEIRRVADTPYQWLSIQSGDSLLSWVSVSEPCCGEASDSQSASTAVIVASNTATDPQSEPS
jgi:predicted transglutaminase-like cysteine proteinase